MRHNSVLALISIIGLTFGTACKSDNSASKQTDESDYRASEKNETVSSEDSDDEPSEAGDANKSKYKSYDLEFFDLYGDVKSVSLQIDDNMEWRCDYGHLPGNAKFDQNGVWINMPGEYKKDSEGKIIELYTGDDVLGNIEFEWDGGFWAFRSLPRFASEYSKDGLLLMREVSADEAQWIDVYTDYVIDDRGNWIQRTHHIIRFNEYYNPMVYSVKNNIEKRDITYYSPNHQRPNADTQLQLIKTFKEMVGKENLSKEEIDNILKKYGIR